MHFDTAAFSLLYDSRILELAIESFGSKKFFWGSDFPLINQSTDLILMNKLNITQKSRNDLLGNNLIHYLNLS